MNINKKMDNKKLMRHTFSIAVLIILLSAVSYAQTRSLTYFKNAEELYNSGDYFSAAKNYEYFLGYESPPKNDEIKRGAYIAKLTKRQTPANNQNNVALYKLLESYHLLPSYYKAELYGKKAITELSVKEYPLVTYWYASALKSNGKFDESKELFLQFIKTYTKKDSYLTRAQLEIKRFDFIKTQLEIPPIVPINVNNVTYEGEAVYGLNKVPVESNVLFTSTIKNIKEGAEAKYETNVYRGILEDGRLINTSSIQFGSEENLMQYGEAVLSRDSNYLFFTGSIGIPGLTPSAIYKSKREGSAWSAPILVGGGVNMTGYSSRNPMLTPDGKYLYFSSNRPGGQGKHDIWYSAIGSDYNPIKATNAGNIINTPEDENSPFYHEKSNSLFFSSNGKIGMGGFDIYQAEGVVGKWVKVINLGSPYNSVKDDLYFFSRQNVNFSEEAYFSSDRNTDCCLELFKATASFPSKIVREEIPVNQIDSLIIYFDFDKSELKGDDISKLNLFAKQITDKFFEIQISGFTDGLGTANYNMGLAKRRVESCIKILKESGIKPEHFVINVGGKCCPVSKETFEDGSDNAEARSKNRRVFIRFTK